MRVNYVLFVSSCPLTVKYKLFKYIKINGYAGKN